MKFNIVSLERRSFSIAGLVSLFACLSCSITLFGQEKEIKYSDLLNVTKRADDYTSYISKDGAVYRIGDRLTIGVPSSNKTFAFIWEGDGILIEMKNLTASMSGTETEIKRIGTIGNKRSGYQVWVRTKGVTGLANYSIQVEKAFETGEIRSFGMTTDEALSELKKAKDKLDLGLITQQRYDSLKTSLGQFIR